MTIMVGSAINAFAQNSISDPFFAKVPYRGAFNTSENWLAGWTNWTPNSTNYSNANVTVEGEIATNQTWTANNTYLIKGFLYVRSGATLTIEPGTVVRGDKATKGTLLIERGAKIIAEGTKEKPIVFTSNESAGSRSYGDWGGIVVCGYASINPVGGTAVVEGGPTSVYGGGNNPNDEDNSGVLKFLRIEFPGIPFVPDKEINGLTLGGVGRQTTLDYIQVSYCGDDSFEWFGGTVNAKHLVSFRGWDDDFDTDYGYSGMIQFALAIRDKEIADPGSGSNGFESDNDANGSENAPLTRPIFSNVTIIGPKYDASTTINSQFKRAMHLRRNTNLKVYNSVFTGFPVGLMIDGAAAQANAESGKLVVSNSVLSGMSDFFKSDFDRKYFTQKPLKNDTIENNLDLNYIDPFNLGSPNMLLKEKSMLKGGSSWDILGVDNEPKYVKNISLFPNPVLSEAFLQFENDQKCFLNIKIYNSQGVFVANIANGMYEAGKHNIELSAKNLSKGIYFIMVEENNLNSKLIKMLVQ